MTTDPAYSEFVLSRQSRLRQTAYLLCGDHGQAEDLLQEALVALAEQWESVEHPDAFVRTVLYRRRVSWWRRRRHEVVPGTLPEVSVEDGSEERARHAEVHSALRTLPQRQRAALVLRYFEDLTEAQTAEILGVAVGTVKSLSYQAVAALRTHLLATAVVAAEGALRDEEDGP